MSEPRGVSETGRRTSSGLGVVTGTVMLLGGVLGPGVLALPSLAAAAGGPASLMAWVLLLAASGPVALTFAALGTRHPGGGGVAHFATLAFGPRATAPVGWWFLAAVPFGTTAGAVMGGRYVAAAVGAGRTVELVSAGVLLGLALALNGVGLRTASRVQVATVALLLVLLVVTIAVSAGRVRASSFTPFAPHGVSGVAVAAAVLFFAFAGWEAATHLSADFADPRRGLRRASVLTVAVVTVLYLGLAVVTVGVFGAAAGDTPAPLSALLRHTFGVVGVVLATAAAVLLTLGALVTYLAGGARLAAALGEQRHLPPRWVGVVVPGREPRRALGLLGGCCALVTVPLAAGFVDLDLVVRVTSALLAAVSVTGTLAGVRLLRGRARGMATAASAFLVVVLICSGALLLVPLAVAGIAASVGHGAHTRPGRRRPERSTLQRCGR